MTTNDLTDMKLLLQDTQQRPGQQSRASAGEENWKGNGERGVFSTWSPAAYTSTDMRRTRNNRHDNRWRTGGSRGSAIIALTSAEVSILAAPTFAFGTRCRRIGGTQTPQQRGSLDLAGEHIPSSVRSRRIGDVQRRLPVAVLQIDVRPAGDHQLDDVVHAGLRRRVQHGV